MTHIIDTWKKCYPSNWKGLIVKDAITHPAKYSSKLIRRIYEHILEMGWVQAGDTVIDPFGGVALGALDAMRLGLRWRGVELEAKFQRIGEGYDCPGDEEEDKSKWCPQCQAEGVAFPEPHHYRGNIELWNSRFHTMPNWNPDAALISGDSRRLLEVLKTESMAAISSPPYNNMQVGKNSKSINREKQYEAYKASGGGQSFEAFCKTQELHSGEYGTSNGQLANMASGDFEAVITSPPFRQATGGTPKPKPGGSIDEALYKRHAAGNGAAEGYGATDGQLANMSEGDFDMALSIPPYAETTVTANRQFKSKKNPDAPEAKDLRENGGSAYGETDGNLGSMPAGEFDQSISSPPYLPQSDRKKPWGSTVGKTLQDEDEARGYKADASWRGSYSMDPANLGNPTGADQTEFWAAARSIVDQVYLSLKPGGHACWVVKDFVKNKKIVPFCDQWRQLCEAAGFITLHEHHAELVRHNGTSHTLEGGKVDHIKSSKSFFRRVAESHGSPEINYEVVYCMEKPR